jgi:hypothetical protein
MAGMITDYFTAKAQRAQRFFVFLLFPETGKSKNQPAPPTGSGQALRGLFSIFCNAFLLLSIVIYLHISTI